MVGVEGLVEEEEEGEGIVEEGMWWGFGSVSVRVIEALSFQ